MMVWPSVSQTFDILIINHVAYYEQDKKKANKTPLEIQKWHMYDDKMFHRLLVNSLICINSGRLFF